MLAITPRRSVLYLPCSNVRAIAKARTLAADTIVFDLEDAVAPDKKNEARDNLVAALEQGGFGRRELIVRVNALETPWGDDDTIAFAASEAHAICLPKVESVEQVHTLEALLVNNGGADKSLWLMAETPKGIINIESIVSSSKRITTLLMGTSDLSKDLRIPFSPQGEGLHYSLAKSVVAARAACIDIIDGVYIDLDDEQGFYEACQRSVKMGFDGKSLIHPKQIATANEAYAPSAQALSYANKIIDAWQECERQGLGVTLVDGRLVEQLHVEAAIRLVALAAAIDELTL